MFDATFYANQEKYFASFAVQQYKKELGLDMSLL